MLLRNIKLVILVLFLTIALPVQAAPWELIHGEIYQVLPTEGKIMLLIQGEKNIYQLQADCLILNSGRPVSLIALRPISKDTFQDALCWVSPLGTIGVILANYNVVEEEGILKNYDIFGNRK